MRERAWTDDRDRLCERMQRNQCVVWYGTQVADAAARGLRQE